jgi:hypothetical protein
MCDACRTRHHGAACAGCGCRCRAMLGLDGPFPDGDPSAPSADDRSVA